MIPIERSAAFEWGFEKGEQAERERIIQLLQEAIDKAELYAEETYGLFEAIELIEGENK